MVLHLEWGWGKNVKKIKLLLEAKCINIIHYRQITTGNTYGEYI